jgi:sugar phosphate isomerase/epimerase
MPPHFPYGDSRAAGEIAALLARYGVRVASLHAPLYPDVRTYKKDRWYSLSSEDEPHRRESVEATVAAATWLSRNGGGTLVLHASFPAEKWYPRRWGAFLGSMNELLAAVPDNVRFAVENTPLPSGRVEIVMDIADRYPGDRVGVCLDLGHANIEEGVRNAIRKSAPRLIHISSRGAGRSPGKTCSRSCATSTFGGRSPWNFATTPGERILPTAASRRF